MATLAGGTFLFLLTQFVSEIVIKPFLRFRGVLEELSATLIYRSGILCSMSYEQAPDLHKEIHFEMRRFAGKLRAAVVQIPFYGVLSAFRCMPSRRNVKEAAGLLIRLSNFTGDKSRMDSNFEDIGKIGVLLKIDTGR